MASTSTDRRFGVNVGRAIKAPCKAATTANITLYGEQTIDGVLCVTDDRVLVKNQTDATQNGIYYVDTGAWKRSPDFDDINDSTQGTRIGVTQGTIYADTMFIVDTLGDITPGTTAVTFSLVFSGAFSEFSGFVFANKAEAVSYIDAAGVPDGKKIFIVSEDGGTFTGVTGAAAATYADNGGAYCGTQFIPTAGDGSSAVVRYYKGPVYIEWFGAAGDGVTDDRTPFVNAIAYLGSIGGGELIAEDDYKFTFGFNINQDNITVNGKGTGRFYFDGTQTQGLRVISATNVVVKNLSSFIPRTNYRTGFYINGWIANSSNVRIENCTFDGGVAGIWFYACDQCVAIGNTVDTPKADGIHFSDGSSNCSAVNNIIMNAGDDAIATTTDAGLTTTTNIVISGNIISDLIWGAGIAIRETNDVVISDNVIKETALAGIRCHSDAGDARCENVTITNNTILGAGRAEKFPYSYWDGSDPAGDTPISLDTNKVGVLLGGTNIKFADNLIRDVESSPSLDTRFGIGITECNGLFINGNRLSEVTDIGIHTVDTGQASLTIKNNQISADGDAISIVNAVTGHLTISENVQLAGSSGTYLITITNTGQVPAMINSNISMDGKLIADGSANLLASFSNNIPEINLTYTPTVSNIVNATAVNPSNFYFMKTGSIMNVYGTLVVTTAVPATDIEFSLTLPRASNITVLNDVWGDILSTVAGSLNTASTVYGNVGGDLINVKLKATSAAATTYNFHCSYIIQ